MKKIIIVLSLLLMTGIMSNAQSFGVKAGLNIANIDADISSTDNRIGFQIGAIGSINYTKEVSINSGLLYSTKGYKDGNNKFRINYLEIPVNIAYKYRLSNMNIFAQAGPYIGIGLSAKAKDKNYSETIKFGSDENKLKRFDFGFNIGAGVEINSIQFIVNYGLGLSNITNFDNNNWKNRVISFSVAHYFGK